MLRTSQERVVVMRQLPAGSMYLEPCCFRATGRISTAAENANLAAEDVSRSSSVTARVSHFLARESPCVREGSINGSIRSARLTKSKSA
jgi:hypothetical protein